MFLGRCVPKALLQPSGGGGTTEDGPQLCTLWTSSASNSFGFMPSGSSDGGSLLDLANDPRSRVDVSATRIFTCSGASTCAVCQDSGSFGCAERPVGSDGSSLVFDSCGQVVEEADPLLSAGNVRRRLQQSPFLARGVSQAVRTAVFLPLALPPESIVALQAAGVPVQVTSDGRVEVTGPIPPLEEEATPTPNVTPSEDGGSSVGGAVAGAVIGALVLALAGVAAYKIMYRKNAAPAKKLDSVVSVPMGNVTVLQLRQYENTPTGGAMVQLQGQGQGPRSEFRPVVASV